MTDLHLRGNSYIQVSITKNPSAQSLYVRNAAGFGLLLIAAPKTNGTRCNQ